MKNVDRGSPTGSAFLLLKQHIVAQALLPVRQVGPHHLAGDIVSSRTPVKHVLTRFAAHPGTNHQITPEQAEP